jgi:hypothetical protein
LLSAALTTAVTTRTEITVIAHIEAAVLFIVSFFSMEFRSVCGGASLSRPSHVGAVTVATQELDVDEGTQDRLARGAIEAP